MNAPNPLDILAARILVDHARREGGHCLCGWGTEPVTIGTSHSFHVVSRLREAGLLVEVAR